MKKIRWGKKDLPGDIKVKLGNENLRIAQSKKQVSACPQQSYFLIKELLRSLDTTLNSNQ